MYIWHKVTTVYVQCPLVPCQLFPDQCVPRTKALGHSVPKTMCPARSILKGTVAPQSTYIGRVETGSVYLPTQLERTLQLYW
jgi:hypothetical protein